LALNRRVNVIMIDTNEFTRALRGEVCSGVLRRRRWTSREKGRIVAEAVAPGAVIAVVARRHDLTPQHLSNWIRAAKAGRLALPAPEESPILDDAARIGFVPVVTEPRCGVKAGIEIIIGAVVVRVAAGADAATLESVLRAVKQA
jgi:transposase